MEPLLDTLDYENQIYAAVSRFTNGNGDTEFLGTGRLTGPYFELVLKTSFGEIPELLVDECYEILYMGGVNRVDEIFNLCLAHAAETSSS
jgi:hypothetical protein